ncbi:GGDEF domain-containing protein [Halomonas campisalis]|uniref:diguanylate cyclase n=2 Tax=Billgrantia campisalis TaxID=74661 RepID=A0ABS9P820_9GAMM|nr:GGDEF domain-containing protein [Halomonas campisalis]MCG6657912.1 GGDEF domain-containing protein [Halomonas campisalis]
MSFTALILLITYETRWVHPEIHAYFSQSGNLTGQQLATRSRGYLQESLGLLLEGADEPAHRERALFQLELAYSLFDIGLYRREYACTEPNLARLDRLGQRLQAGEAPTPTELNRSLLAPIGCLTEIEMGQLDRRGLATNQFVEETRRHQTLVLLGSLLIYVLGIVFWWMHERQRRSAERATRESLKWMSRAMLDPLTGVGNRSALNEEIVQREGRPVGLLLIDIDFFKQYNDALGHPDGDRLLRRLAMLIDESLAGQARLYRMGGDEFAALLDCHEDATLAGDCQRLTEQLRAASLDHPAHPHSDHVTLSIGAARFIAGEAGLALGYAAADQALYRVKGEGRDGWEVARVEAAAGNAGA